LGRLAKGTLANVIRQVLNVGGQLALVPILLTFWGTELYGEWQILAATVAYITLLDFGIQTYVVNCMNQRYSRGEFDEFTRLLHTALAFSGLTSVAALLLILPAILSIPLTSWFSLTITEPNTARAVAAVLACQTVCSLPAGVVGGTYRAIGEYARDLTVANVHRLTVLLLTAGIVISGGGLLAIASLQLVTLVAAVLFLWADLTRRHPEFRLGFRRANLHLARSFLGPSALFFLMQISMALSFQGSTLLIGATMGAGSVAIFVTLRALVNAIPQATTSLSSTLWPELTSLDARGKRHILAEIHRFATKGFLWLCFCAVVLLHFFGEDVVRLWTNGRILYDRPLMTAFLGLQIVVTAYLMSALILNATNNHRIVAFAQLGSVCLGLTAGYFLLPHYGPAGLVLGMLLAEVVICGLLIPRSACRLLGESFSSFGINVLGRGAGILCVFFGAAHLMVSSLSGRPILERMIVSGPVLLLAGTVATYFLWLDDSERKRMKEVLLAVRRIRLSRLEA
jgi:O-antigen/teichoic acid export membrane protein